MSSPVAAFAANLLRRVWQADGPDAGERRILRRVLGDAPAAFFAGTGGEAWVHAVMRVKPAAQIHRIDETPLDGFCTARGIRHADLLWLDTADGVRTLGGADALLGRSRIDLIVLGGGRDAALDPAAATLLQARGYERIGKSLVIHQRLKPLVLDGPKRMLDLGRLCQAHGVVPRGVIHVGAHDGGEWDDYVRMGITDALFIEANPAVFARLAAKLGATRGVTLAQCAIAAENGRVTLHVTSSDQSSSILPLQRHRDYYPSIVETATVEVEARSLDALLAERDLSPVRFNLLNMDIQGAELMALSGAERLLPTIAAINVEINFEELYAGCAQVEELDDFLRVRGFVRVATTCPYHKSWGDAFYVRASPGAQPVTAMP